MVAKTVDLAIMVCFEDRFRSWGHPWLVGPPIRTSGAIFVDLFECDFIDQAVIVPWISVNLKQAVVHEFFKRLPARNQFDIHIIN